MNFWDRKSNLANKPTMKNKNILVIDHAKEKYNLPEGAVIDKLIEGEINYKELLMEVREKGMDNF